MENVTGSDEFAKQFGVIHTDSHCCIVCEFCRREKDSGLSEAGILQLTAKLSII